MEEQNQLAVQPRSVVGKHVKTLRQEGLVPMVVYGQSEPVNIQASEFDTKRAIAHAGGQLMALNIEGEAEPRMVLARELQRDPISGRLLHADFQEVNIYEQIQVEVSLTPVGEPHLVNTGEAILLQVLNEVEIECLPTEIMQTIEVDTSHLQDFEEAIYVRDLRLPEGITILTPGDEMIVRLEPVMAEEEEEVEVVEEVAEVEVITRAKEEEEEED